MNCDTYLDIIIFIDWFISFHSLLDYAKECSSSLVPDTRYGPPSHLLSNNTGSYRLRLLYTSYFFWTQYQLFCSLYFKNNTLFWFRCSYNLMISSKLKTIWIIVCDSSSFGYFHSRILLILNHLKYFSYLIWYIFYEKWPR